MTEYSQSTGNLLIAEKEETLALAGALTALKLDHPPVDVFDVNRIAVSSDPDVAADYGTSVEDYGTTPLDDTTVQLAQMFKAGHTMVNTVQLYMLKSSDFAGTVKVEIQTDNSTEPSGTPVGTAITKAAAALSTTKTLETFTFTDVTGMTDDDPYWIVITLSAVTAGKVEVFGNANSASSYADGTCQVEPDGLGWDVYANADIWFRVDHDTVDVADASISAYVQKFATDGQVTLGASSDDNAVYEVTYSYLRVKDLDDYLDTYTGWHLAEHVMNALCMDEREFYFALGMLIQKGNVEVSHTLCKIDPSGGTTAGSLETLRYKCTPIDELKIHGA